jgi:hypothetical protein
MRAKGRWQGRFVSAYGLRKIVCAPGNRYELVVVDSEGRPVSHLTEWYRLRKTPGLDGTRRTYLGIMWNTSTRLLALLSSMDSFNRNNRLPGLVR